MSEHTMREALEAYMSAFGQALEFHGISFGAQQKRADEQARAALAAPKMSTDHTDTLRRLLEHAQFNPNRTDDAAILRGRLLQIQDVVKTVLAALASSPVALTDAVLDDLWFHHGGQFRYREFARALLAAAPQAPSADSAGGTEEGER